MKRDAASKEAAHAAEIARVKREVSDLKKQQKRSETPLPRAATALVLAVLSFVLAIAGTAVWAGHLDEPKPAHASTATTVTDEQRPVIPADRPGGGGRRLDLGPTATTWSTSSGRPNRRA